jgi:CheY-like chemotaxis protein
LLALLKLRLEFSANNSIREASTGAETLMRLRDQPWDLLILDISAQSLHIVCACRHGATSCV